MEEFLEKLKKSPWARQRDESLNHFADCHIHGFAGVCTCGLFHYLLPYWYSDDFPRNSELLNLVKEEDWDKHQVNLFRLEQDHLEKEMAAGRNPI